MKTNRIKRRLRNNEPSLITTLHLVDPLVYELASLIGIEGIWMDMEHRGYGLETAQMLMTAAKAGGESDILVRTSRGEFAIVTKVLEAGAQGVIYPRCQTASEAREVVNAAKFPPLGERGCDGWNRDAPFGTIPIADYVQMANEQTLVIIQIESPTALANAGEIAQVEGVDALMFGMGDYSVFSGVPGQVLHPQVLDAGRRTCEAALAAGKHFGQPAGTMEAVDELLDMGGRLVFHNADVLFVDRGLRSIKAQFDQIRERRAR